MTALDVPTNWPELVPDQVVWPRLVALRDCLCACIGGREAPDPCICVIVPGQVVATDYCNPCSNDDSCGMAWVRLNSAYPSSVFPVQDVSQVGMGCSAILAFEIELGVVRCVPAGDEYGNPPTEQQWEKAAELQVADMMAIREAVKCCFHPQKTMFGAYQSIGPEGGCVGGAWNVFVSTESTGGDVHRPGVQPVSTPWPGYWNRMNPEPGA